MARHAGTRGQTIEPGPFAHINHHWDSLGACYGRVVSSCVSYIVRTTVLGQALEALYIYKKKHWKLMLAILGSKFQIHGAWLEKHSSWQLFRGTLAAGLKLGWHYPGNSWYIQQWHCVAFGMFLLDAELLEKANLNQMGLNSLIKQGLVVSAKFLYVLVISLTRLMSYVLAWGIFLWMSRRHTKSYLAFIGNAVATVCS